MKNNTNLSFRIFNYSLFVLLGLITLYPFWYTLVGSLIPFSEYASKTLLLFPSKLMLDAYGKIFTSHTILNGFKVTIFITIVGTLLNLFFTSIAAYSLSIKNLPGRNFILYFILITMLFSGGLIPMFMAIKTYGLLNNVWVYIVPMLINTFYLIILKTSFGMVPDSLRQSALIDGCNEIGVLFRIFIPVSKPVLAAIALFYAVDRWNELYNALFFVIDPEKFPLQMVLYNMIRSVDIQGGQNVVAQGQQVIIAEQVKMAAIIVTTVPILAVYPFLQKYFVKGVMIGAIKG